MLGALEVEGETGPVAVGGFRVRTLLALLALEAGRTVTAERLIDALWPGEPPANAANALQTLVRRLRAALRPAEVVRSRPGGYVLAVPADDVDALRFGRLARQDPEAALALWRGPALAGLTSVPHLANVAASLEDERLSAVESLLQQGRTAGLDLLAEVAAHPLRERLAALAMRALAADGRQADALALFERTRARLADELGVDPGPDLRDAHLSVLTGELPRHVPVRQAVPEPAPPENGALPRSNLRRPLTSFIGREDELAQLTGLLGEARLVTIVGPGGAGKTRLATEAALRMTPGWIVELAPITDPGGLPAAVLDALGLREGLPSLHPDPTRQADGAPARVVDGPLARVVDALGHHRAVIVLDNCEHLVDAAATLTESLLADCPGLRVLATSREPLNVPGERLAPIPSLELPPMGVPAELAVGYPAVRLLIDRAANFALDAGNTEAVVSLCRRLDGMPLAIELAAARLRTMTARQLADRLDDRFRLLTGGSRTALPRQQTLRAVVEWSWDLLDGQERTLARRLAVFAGGAGLESVEAVCDATPDVLGALVDKSLVQVAGVHDGGGRYTMLETIRAYALERLSESGEEAEYRRRHAVHLMELAERAVPELRTATQLEWMERLTAERDNWAAALHWAHETGDVEISLRLCAALNWFWWMGGYHQESAAWATRAMELAGNRPPEGLVRAYVACRFAYGVSLFGELVSDKGAMERLAAEMEELVDAAEREGPVHPLLLISRVVMASASGQDEYATELVGRYLESDDPWLAACARMIGPPGGRSEEGLEQAAAAFRKLGDRWGLSEALLGLAFMRAARGAPTDDLIAEAGSLTFEWVSPMERISSLTRLASLRVQAGDLEGAGADLARCRSMADADTPVFALIQLGLAECQLSRVRGDLAGAVAGFEEMIGLLVDAPPVPQFVAAVHTGYGRILAELGDGGQALEQHRIALDKLGDNPDLPMLSAVLAGFALAEQAAGDAERAAVLFGASAAVEPADQAPDTLAGAESARQTLGSERFERLYGRGGAMTREEVYELIGSTR
ncbi:BTAD domain-containing putative transcriptional regulator [Nonomuraea sp. NPDC050536]|uniref:BTAD domain-containing putative transcriptional regulator n=1 Tax=Nonomuraea sp. NPDC050536 TaxID=3364366 RepID=UPI0037C9A027